MGASSLLLALLGAMALVLAAGLPVRVVPRKDVMAEKVSKMNVVAGTQSPADQATHGVLLLLRSIEEDIQADAAMHQRTFSANEQLLSTKLPQLHTTAQSLRKRIELAQSELASQETLLASFNDRVKQFTGKYDSLKVRFDKQYPPFAPATFLETSVSAETLDAQAALVEELTNTLQQVEKADLDKTYIAETLDAVVQKLEAAAQSGLDTDQALSMLRELDASLTSAPATPPAFLEEFTRLDNETAEASSEYGGEVETTHTNTEPTNTTSGTTARGGLASVHDLLRQSVAILDQTEDKTEDKTAVQYVLSSLVRHVRSYLATLTDGESDVIVGVDPDAQPRPPALTDEEVKGLSEEAIKQLQASQQEVQLHYDDSYKHLAEAGLAVLKQKGAVAQAHADATQATIDQTTQTIKQLTAELDLTRSSFASLKDVSKRLIAGFQQEQILLQTELQLVSSTTQLVETYLPRPTTTVASQA